MIRLFHDQVILGLSIKAGEKIGSFGRTEFEKVSESKLEQTSIIFSENEPLMGLYGHNGPQFIHSMGFIRLDRKACWPAAGGSTSGSPDETITWDESKEVGVVVPASKNSGEKTTTNLLEEKGSSLGS